MKNILLMIALAVLTCCGTAQDKKDNVANANSATAKEQEKTQNETTMKALVTYFSASGVTRNAAKQVADIIGADLFEITPEQLYTDADLDWRDKQSRSTIEMQDKSSRPAINGRCENIAQYDTVWIGFPVWWYIAPTIVNTFIEAHDLSGKTLNVFATSGGSPVEPCTAELQKTYPQYTWGQSRLMK